MQTTEVQDDLTQTADSEDETQTSEPSHFRRIRILGHIVAPKNYDHKKSLSTFSRLYGACFKNLDDSLKYGNYKHPTHIMQPEEKFRVDMFGLADDSKLELPGLTLASSAVELLKKRRYRLLGAQAMPLCWIQLNDELKSGSVYMSLDDPENLFEDSRGLHKIPILDCRKQFNPEFWTMNFEAGIWLPKFRFLAFKRIKQ